MCSSVFPAEKQGGKPTKNGENTSQTKPEPTWVEDLFQGTFTNETRCLNCETVSDTKVWYKHPPPEFWCEILSWSHASLSPQ